MVDRRIDLGYRSDSAVSRSGLACLFSDQGFPVHRPLAPRASGALLFFGRGVFLNFRIFLWVHFSTERKKENFGLLISEMSKKQGFTEKDLFEDDDDIGLRRRRVPSVEGLFEPVVRTSSSSRDGFNMQSIQMQDLANLFKMKGAPKVSNEEFTFFEQDTETPRN